MNKDNVSIECGPLNTVPNVFCWTKMQAEAGQTLDFIIRRKELERTIGGGHFFWGVGNALGSSIHTFTGQVANPEVLFSIMRSKPRAQDVAPETLYLWTKYVGPDGNPVKLPPHVLLLSRGNTTLGRKTHHYALVCHSETPLSQQQSSGAIDIAHLCNFGGNQGKLGYSQVTAVVAHKRTDAVGSTYNIAFRAGLKAPHFVRLVEPITLTKDDSTEIENKILSNPSPENWRAFVENLRRRLEIFS